MGMDVAAPGSGKKKGRSAPEMNVTPLVDVVLVLLIIFMVVTPLMHAHFWVHVPSKPDDETEEPAEPDPNDAPVVVTVLASGQIRINRDVVSDGELPIRLRRILAAKGDRKIFFDAEDGARFARAVEVLDLARGAGAAHIAVTTEALR
jgi:biopolymer transport protein ExbD/biopolymer transport protein TolR